MSRNDLDPLGRIVATWADDAAGAEPDVSWTYDFDVERAGAGTHTPAMVEQRQLIDRTEPQARHVRTRTFLDGFGRELQRRQSGEAGWIVHARGYGAQASMDREWLSDLDAAEDYAAPDGARPVRRYVQDAPGRVAETVSPDGGVERVTREPWVVVEHDREDTDPASPHHDTPRRVESDAAGRMTRVVDRIVYAPASEDAEAITLLRHDALGRLVERRDPSGLVATTGGRPTGASSGASTRTPESAGRSTTPPGTASTSATRAARRSGCATTPSTASPPRCTAACRARRPPSPTPTTTRRATASACCAARRRQRRRTA